MRPDRRRNRLPGPTDWIGVGMAEHIDGQQERPAEVHEPLRRLPWDGPEGKPAYVPPGDGMINRLANSTEAHILNVARDDAAYALAMVELPGTSRAELCLMVRKLAGTVSEVAKVADLRGERLAEPAYAPAVRALSEALREAFRA